MKRIILVVIIFLFFGNCLFSQIIPTYSSYLGQIQPTDEVKIFKLAVDSGFFATERITISNDGKEIYYSEIKSYYPINSAIIKNYSFTEGKWTGPFVLFENYCAPALSITGDTMYMENKNSETFISIKKGSKWSVPERILTKLESAHYLQVTNNGNSYISSKPKNSIGLADWCKLSLTAIDTSAVSLGQPLNTIWDNFDFFISPDESYMIVTTPFGLSISYPKSDGSWTNPRNLGAKINFGLGMWGPYVTKDNNYLFYTTGTKSDYSDVNVHWVRVDGIIDSLKYANIPPYLKNKIISPVGIIGQSYNYTIPDNTFFDEDGTTVFEYSVSLNTGNPLPLWLTFNEATKTFSGTPNEACELLILVIAKDEGNALGLAIFKLLITNKQ